MNKRTKAELTIMKSNIDALRIIRNEQTYAETIGVCIPAELDTVESITKYLDETAQILNSATDTDGNQYTVYDMETPGTYICTYETENKYHGRKTPSKSELYMDTLLDKWHKVLSLAYYRAHNLAYDFAPRPIVVPVSACDEPWLLDKH